MSIATVETSLMAIMNSISGVTAYDNDRMKLLSLPALTLQFNQVEQERFKYGMRRATYTFFLRLYVGMKTGEDEGFSEFKTHVDAVLTAFNDKSQADLLGTVLTQDITLGTLEVQIDAQNPRYLQTFTLTVTEEV